MTVGSMVVPVPISWVTGAEGTGDTNGDPVCAKVGVSVVKLAGSDAGALGVSEGLDLGPADGKGDSSKTCGGELIVGCLLVSCDGGKLGSDDGKVDPVGDVFCAFVGTLVEMEDGALGKFDGVELVVA
eukprot:CAMPEP_0194156974 /NCGR_PEP_ID=MMETSP0152-20130528/70260_1 /TAXON_ID=1049557 /ORGANISM="Thalassiothrix antarctica, Strain L6-D1" /LENGTH=127 /DNA_ID=CAMNT_0038865043 /DNA_START=258 /DNA_END=641 /DNA_ORIENTATION=+